MVGFSLAHGVGAILLVFPLLLFIWLIAVAGLTIRSLIKKHRITAVRWAALTFAVLIIFVGELPEGYWERMFISRMAASPRKGDLLVYATYRGDFGTVRDLISHGVPVDATDHADWKTAMHGAAQKGDLRTLRYLVSKGADINALDRSGDSPLELASSAGEAEAVQFLTEHGAKRVRGDDAQRQKAVEDRVREATEELDREEAADKNLQKDIKKAEQEEEQRPPTNNTPR